MSTVFDTNAEQVLVLVSQQSVLYRAWRRDRSLSQTERRGELAREQGEESASQVSSEQGVGDDEREQE